MRTHARLTAPLVAVAAMLLAAACPAAAASAAVPTPTATSAPSTTAAPPAPPTSRPATPDVAAGVTHEQNPSVPVGAVWTEHYLASPVPTRNGDPVELHADVLRPADLPADAKTPVVLIIGPYLSHAGMQEDEGKPYTGPSLRHRAFIDDGDLMASGYTVVLGDLRGFGGSSGCYDFTGPGEQADVRAFVEWAASAPWSTGRVGMYGKSYDAVTGLIALADRPAGLAAVVAQEPSWSLYDYLWENGIPAENNRTTIEAYTDIAGLPGIDHAGAADGVVIPPDTERYRTNAAYETTHPECAEGIAADTLSSDPDSSFWSVRDLPSRAEGSTIPLFLTQGWTEENTRPDGMSEYLDAIEGPVTAWAGPWNHVAGNDVDEEGRLQMGRAGWVEEVRSFFDAHLMGAAAPTPAWALQDNTGRWRSQPSWPGTTRAVSAAIAPGTYLDTGTGAAALEPGAERDGSLFGTAPRDARSLGGSQTLSAPAAEATRLSGQTVVDLHARGTGVAHVRLWDVDTEGVPTLIVEEVSPLDGSGRTQLRLRNADWTLQRGHALLLSVGTTDSLAWRPTPSGEVVTIDGGTMTVPLSSPAADVATEGEPAPFLAAYLENARWPVPLGSVAASFTLDPPTTAPSSPSPSPRLAESGTTTSPAPALWGAAALAAGVLVVIARRSRARDRDHR